MPVKERGDGSHRNGSHGRSVGDVGNGYFELSLLPNWDDLENAIVQNHYRRKK